jgi:lipopolysaccharide transport system permease protein
LQKNKILEGVRLIKAQDKGWKELKLCMIWQYRSLLVNFTIRDIKAHYAQTRVGIIWSFIQALTAAIVIQVFFGVLLKISIPGVPYIIYAFPGMIAWYLFSFIIGNSGTSLMQSQHIIRKIYFPKLILPIYKTLVGLIEFLIWFVLFLFLLIYFHYPLHLRAFLLPLGIFLNMIVGLSIGIWLSALTIRYRDAFHIIPYLVGFGVFVTPVFYESTMVPSNFHFLIFLNPMAGIIAFYRWCLLDMDLSLNYLFGIIPAISMFLFGLFYFRKVEGTMADLI